METPPREAWPQEGRLIEEAREQLRPKLSQNEAGRRAGHSGARWRQIVYRDAGEMTSSRGVRTLARMATIVGLVPGQLDELGRADIAAEMKRVDLDALAPTEDEAVVRFTVEINVEDPEPEFPPGGLRNQTERIIWAMDDPWQVRWSYIQAGREAAAALASTDDRAAEHGE